jgi:hypothetical protein
MTEIWYENPEILLNNLDQFIPNNKLSKINNINSIARFAIYLSIIILILKQDNRWLLIPILLLAISYYLNISRNFSNIPQKIISNIIPQLIEPLINIKSTIDNPYMNYITNNSTTINPNSFPQLLPKNLSINSNIQNSLNSYNKEDSLNIPINPLSQSIKSNIPSTPKNINISDTFGSILLNSNVEKNTIITNQTIEPKDNTELTFNNTINYDLCITSNDNKSCTPDNKIIEDSNNLPNKFKINKDHKKYIKKNYRSHLKFDSIDMWGKLINDRNYYTSPNINIVNDQSGFAEWCYTNNGSSGKCKTDGSNCVKDRDVRYHRGRISTNN